MNPLIECVPNFSEGRDQHVIQEIETSIISVPEVKHLHTDMGYDANRTVITFVGPPDAVAEAAYKAIKKASELIDMQTHEGAHPRIGATDVCPLIPIANFSMKEAVLLSKKLAQQVGKELNIPIYLYENSTNKPNRKNLANIRKGNYEGIAKKIVLPEWKPDYGPSTFNAKSGSTVIGARNFLIAYNVNLNSKDIDLAKHIAKEIRTSGRSPNKLKAVKAIGWYMDTFDCAQVSTNIIDFNTSSLPLVFETIKAEALKLGVTINGSELIGMIPESCWQMVLEYYKANDDEGIKALGLNELAPFNLDERIIERKMKTL